MYLKIDILLLTDVFETFVKICLEYYRLYPCHYFDLPGLSWDAMLKMTRVKLDLISDTDMHLLIEKGIKGEISYIAKRRSKINDDTKTIMYWDVNNLYGYAMSQIYGEFDWLTKKEINEFSLNSISENSPIGYI